MSTSNFTIGCDPEVFVTKNTKPVSAYGLIPGDKKNPHAVHDGAVQVDGMALEFNTEPLSLSVSASLFSRRVLNVRDFMERMVKEKDPELVISNLTTADFEAEYLASQPDEAKELGCDPDWNAYTKALNEAPDGNVNFRAAGGHIHVGWGADIPVDNPDHIEICSEFIKVMDLFLGIPSVVLDSDVRRRQMYGKAGAFRPKPYGVEYRTLSNFWIQNATLRQFAFNATKSATQALQNYGGDAARTIASYIPNTTPEDVQRVINENDVATAQNWCRYLRYAIRDFDTVLTKTGRKVK